jgi:hypothetical protein
MLALGRTLNAAYGLKETRSGLRCLANSVLLEVTDTANEIAATIVREACSRKLRLPMRCHGAAKPLSGRVGVRGSSPLRRSPRRRGRDQSAGVSARHLYEVASLARCRRVASSKG